MSWQLCNVSVWLDWPTFPRISLLAVSKWQPTRDILRRFSEQKGGSSHFASWTHWYANSRCCLKAACVCICFTFPEFFTFSDSWARYVFTSMRKGPDFFWIPTSPISEAIWTNEFQSNFVPFRSSSVYMSSSLFLLSSNL